MCLIMNIKNTLFSLCLFRVLMTSATMSAQNTTASPYSMFGLGEMESGSSGVFAGMGDVALALRNSSYLGISNPAALTAIKPNAFVSDMALYGEYRTMMQGGSRENNLLGNLRNMAIGCRLFPSVYASVGITPMSSVGYALRTSSPVEGSSENSYTYFEGSGGLSKLYLGSAVSIGANLSLGVNFSYVYGRLYQVESQGASSVEKSAYTHAFYPDLGLQYHLPLSSERSLTFGLTYGYKQKVTLENTLQEDIDGTESKTLPSTRQYLPQYYGVGFSYAGESMLIALDYLQRNYSSMRSESTTVSYNDQYKVSLGIDYIPVTRTAKKTHWMIGASLANTYMMIRDKKGMVASFSMGTSLPTNTMGNIGLALKYERQAYKQGGGINENRISLQVNVQISELSIVRKLQ